MIKLAVIADDLTGANDTAVQFAKQGLHSCVWLNLGKQDLLNEKTDVAVFDTDSRAASPAEAYHRVQQVCLELRQAGVSCIYKKVDSTLRGNLGAEIEAAAQVFQPEIVVVAPAFPSNDRITVGGYHLLHQQPITLTEIARDPKAPVTEARLPELLRQQTKCKIAHIPLHIIMAGTSAIEAAVAEKLKQGERWLVFDAVTDEHLRQIARAAQVYNKVLWVGSAGLAESLPELYKWSKGAKPDFPLGSQDSVLLVAGSVSQTTRRQIATFLHQPTAKLVAMNVPVLLSQREDEIRRCVLASRTLLAAGQDVVLASAIHDNDVLKAVIAGEKAGFSKVEVSNWIAAALGEIVAQLAGIRLAGMVLTGGDTAVHVCRALGADAIEVLNEVTVGIPLGELVGGLFNGLKVVTKAGAFGDEQALVKAMAAIKA